MEEQNNPTPEEDVEAHGYGSERPAEDVEAHGYGSERPTEDRDAGAEEPDVEGHLLGTPTEKPTE